ncbi:hypothetical protein CD351_09600 [Erythrobacter sp. KY5]|nr:hypothetical protein CD351_09600 [Erythrobacter sp. KY5]
MRVAATLLSLASLSACDLFNDEDPRVGVEEIDACIERVRSTYHEGVLDLLDSDEQRRPTYTFDITKMGFDDIKDLTVPDQGDEKGSVQVSGFEAPGYVKRRFLEMNVDGKGAFFLGADPAYYRVQGEPIALKDVFSEGCKQQLSGMRFLSFTFAPVPASGDVTDDSSTPEENKS